MTTTALVWLVVGLVSLTAVLAVLIALIRHLFVLGRAASRFQAEVSPLAREIGDQGRNAIWVASDLMRAAPAKDTPGPASPPGEPG